MENADLQEVCSQVRGWESGGRGEGMHYFSLGSWYQGMREETSIDRLIVLQKVSQ
jgi:hypothetical protein